MAGGFGSRVCGGYGFDVGQQVGADTWVCPHAGLVGAGPGRQVGLPLRLDAGGAADQLLAVGSATALLADVGRLVDQQGVATHVALEGFLAFAQFFRHRRIMANDAPRVYTRRSTTI